MMGIKKWIGITISERNLTPCLQIRDMNGGQTCAFIVFASLFLSAIYILNGRKVVTWIL